MDKVDVNKDNDSGNAKERGKKIVTAAAAALFLISGALSAYAVLAPQEGTVEIVSDGKVVCTLDPAKERDREIIVEYDGRRNVIAVENGDIYMKEADCPDHTCIKTGRLGSGVPIVCLPNRLVIRYKDGGGDLDASAG